MVDDIRQGASQVTTALNLLSQADHVLTGNSPQRNRMACCMARSALEAVVADLPKARSACSCRNGSHGSDEPTDRSSREVYGR